MRGKCRHSGLKSTIVGPEKRSQNYLFQDENLIAEICMLFGIRRNCKENETTIAQHRKNRLPPKKQPKLLVLHYEFNSGNLGVFLGEKN